MTEKNTCGDPSINCECMDDNNIEKKSDTPESTKPKTIKVVPKQKKNQKKIDYLDEDDVISSQRFMCISFLSPEGIMNCKIRGLKVRGCYSTYDEAKARADQLQKLDKDFHVFVGEVGKWLPWDPDPESVTDQVYNEQKLNDLMKAYKDNREKAKIIEKQRQDDLTSEAIRTNDDKKKKRHDRLKKKLNDKHKNDETNPDDNSDDEDVPPQKEKSESSTQISEKIAEVDNKIKELSQDQIKASQLNNKVQNTKSSISSIDDELEKMEQIYNKLYNKQ